MLISKPYDRGEKPVEGMTDNAADALRKRILSSENRPLSDIHGNIYYLSESGNDLNRGNSPEAPWKTLSALQIHRDAVSPGDAVLFERGGIFRGNFETVSGVYYGAYGEGEKPVLTSSLANYADASWNEVSENIWQCSRDMGSDIGVAVFNGGELIGYKKEMITQLSKNGDFFCEDGNIYVFCGKCPAEAFNSIELGPRITVIGLYNRQQGVTVENLCVRFAGAHGIASTDGVKDITIRNCEFGYIGGSYLKERLRFGNAVEFYDGCANILVEKNWIYQIYDSGITHQGAANYTAANIVFRENLIEYCGMGSIEYWLAYDNEHFNCAENVTYADNIMRYAGFCWGGFQRPDKVSAHILSNGNNQNRFINYKITGNIFDQSTYDLIEITSLDKTYPMLSGNTYIQSEGARFGSFADKRDIMMNGDTERTVREILGDTRATLKKISG